MANIGKGANTSLPPQVGRVRVVLGWSGGPDLDATALLLTGGGTVRDDADMIFYNQPRSADGSVQHRGKSGREDTLAVDLGALPAVIETVAVSASTDGAPFGQVSGLHVRVLDDASGSELVRYDVTDAATETAFVLGELYRRGGAWKFRAVGQGWASGLAGLATDYGISVDDEPAAAATPAPAARQQWAPPAAAPAPTAPPSQWGPPAAPPASAAPAPGGQPISMAKAVRLDKQLAGKPPAMVNLVKRAGVSLEKAGLGTHRARVALCLDISASMGHLFRSGKVQQLCERVLALAVQFDDDGSCDVFTFGTGGYNEGPLDLQNYQSWTQNLQNNRRLEGGTNYNKAIQALRQHYFPDAGGGHRSQPAPAKLPVYVMFVTDGHTTDENGTRDQIMWSSYEPIFWEFMAIGQSSRNVTPGGGAPAPKKAGRMGFGARLASMMTGDFKFLEELDDMPGRYLDNADFFSVSDPGSIPDDQLYDLMMNEYPGWLQQARQRGLIPPG